MIVTAVSVTHHTRASSIFILADDLSGAADCAVGGTRAGLKSVVLLDGSVAEPPDVVAVDADSRYRTPEESRAVNHAIWRAHAAPGRLFYKKIDSTLRGNFATDTAALVAAGVAIVAPAFPNVGRTTRYGRVVVDGVPLERTGIWSNEPIQGEADIVAMLRSAGASALNVSLETVRGDLRAALARLVWDGQVQALVCDAETDDDLGAIAAASDGLPVYFVGSAGLLPHVIRAAGLEGRAEPPHLAFAGAIVTVVGSLADASRRQVRALESREGVATFELAPEVLRARDDHPAWHQSRDQLEQALSAGGDAIIRTAVAEHVDIAEGRVLCESLGQWLAASAPRVGALVVTGGETARAVLMAMGVRGLHLAREVAPGIALSLTLGERSIPVITKAGAFGSSSALLDCYRELAAIRRAAAHGTA